MKPDGKKSYQRNVVKVTSLHHFFLIDQTMLFMCARGRERAKSFLLLLYGYQESIAPPSHWGNKERSGKHGLWKGWQSHTGLHGAVGNSSGVGLVWWGQRVSLDPAHPVLKEQLLLWVTSHWPESSKTKGKSYLPWNGPSHGALRNIPPTIFLSLLDSSHPQKLVSALMSSGLVMVAAPPWALRSAALHRNLQLLPCTQKLWLSRYWWALQSVYATTLLEWLPHHEENCTFLYWLSDFLISMSVVPWWATSYISSFMTFKCFKIWWTKTQ